MANNLSSPQDLSGSAWRTLNATVSLDAATAPDGTTTADKFQETAANAQHYIMQDNPTPSTSGATRQRAWFFFKPVERTRIYFEADDSNFALGGVFATFDCSGSGAVLAVDNASTGTWGTGCTFVSASIQALTGSNAGWYYGKVVFDTTNPSMAPYWILDNGSGAAASSIVYAGTAGNGGYLWETGLNPDATADSYTAILAGGPIVTGAQTLSRPTQTSTIAVRDTVTGAQTLSRPTQSSTIAVTDTVTGAQTLSRPTQTSSISTSNAVAITGSQTLVNPSQSSTIAVTDAVTGSQTLSRPTQTSAVAVTDAVTGAQATSAATQSSAVAVTDAVTGSQTLPVVTQSSAVAVTDAVTGSQTLSRPTQSSAIAAIDAVTGAQTTSAPTQSSAIVVVSLGRTVTGAQTLSSPSQSGSIGVRVAVTGAQTLARPTHTSALTSAQLARNVTGSQLLLPVRQAFMVRSRIWQSTARPGGIWTNIPDPGPTIWTDL
jgi:hypothetical protein